MLVIPDLIEISFNYNQMLGFATNITIFVYLFVITATCVMDYYKKIKIKVIEWIMFITCLLFLISQFITLNYNMNHDLVTNRGIILITIVIKFLMFWLFIIIATIFFIYYKPKLKQRLIKNPEYQIQLDQEFILNSNVIVN